MPVLLAEHSFDCNFCHVVARHGCTHQHGRDRIEIHHSRFCGAKIVFFSGSVVGLIAHIPFFCLTVSGACFLGCLLRIPAEHIWWLTVNLDNQVWRQCPHSLASWELDLVMFCIAIRARTLPCHAFVFLALPWRGLSLALPVWWCSDKILLTSLWPTPKWLPMSVLSQSL